MLKQARTKQTSPIKVTLRNVPGKIKKSLQVIYEACGFTKEEALDKTTIAPHTTTVKTAAWKEALLLIYSNAKINTKKETGGKLYEPDTQGDIVGPHLAYEAIIEEMKKRKSVNELSSVLKFIVHEVGSRMAQFEDEEQFPKKEFIKVMGNISSVQMGNKEYSDVRCKVVPTNEYGDDEFVACLRRVHGSKKVWLGR